jgi:hypothetical protein
VHRQTITALDKIGAGPYLVTSPFSMVFLAIMADSNGINAKLNYGVKPALSKYYKGRIRLGPISIRPKVRPIWN